jgi:hypothetical protein
MDIGSTIPGHILTTHLLPPRSKKGDGPLVQREIYFKPKNSKATLPTQRTCLVPFMAGADVDVMNFKPKEDDLMGDDTTMDDGNAETLPTPAPKLKSTITNELSGSFMEVLTTPKGVSENKPTVNAIATLQRKNRNSKVPN